MKSSDNPFLPSRLKDGARRFASFDDEAWLPAPRCSRRLFVRGTSAPSVEAQIEMMMPSSCKMRGCSFQQVKLQPMALLFGY